MLVGLSTGGSKFEGYRAEHDSRVGRGPGADVVISEDIHSVFAWQTVYNDGFRTGHKGKLEGQTAWTVNRWTKKT